MNKGHCVKKIGIMGPFGYGNLGDAAIQDAMLQHVRQYFPNAEIFGYSLNPKDTEVRHGITSRPIGWATAGNEFALKATAWLRNHSNGLLRQAGRLLARIPMEPALIIRAYKGLKDFDYFIISGGGQLDDYWGGPWSHPYTMLKFALLARLRKAKVMFVSVGAGPIDARLSRLFIRAALSLADYRSYRDPGSKELIASIGFKRDDPVYPDLAHSLQVDAHQNRPRSGNGRAVVGVGPMTYFDPRIWPERDGAVYENYLKKLSTFVLWLLEQKNRVVFITGEADHDRWAIQDLRKLIEAEVSTRYDDQIVEEPIETVGDLLCEIARTDLVVASRFHGVLLSQLMNRPVLALSYHEKIDALMADTGQADYCLPIDSFDVSVLKERFLALDANSEKSRDEIAHRSQFYRDALETQYARIFG